MDTSMSSFEKCPVEIITQIGETTIQPFTTVSSSNPCIGGYQSLRNLCRCSKKLESILRPLLGTHIKVYWYGRPASTFTKLLNSMLDDRVQSRLSLVQEFTLSTKNVLTYGAREFVDSVHRVLKGMTSLKKIRVDSGQQYEFAIDFTGRVSPSFRLESVEQVAVARGSYWFLRYLPNVTRVATMRSIPTDNCPFEPKYDTKDFIEAILCCPEIDTVEIETTWDRSLIQALFAVKPNLKRLGMMGSKTGQGAIRYYGYADWALGEPYATDGILLPCLHEVLSKFKKLEVLVIPHLLHSGVFVVPHGIPLDTCVKRPDLLSVPNRRKFSELYDVEDDDVSKDVQRSSIHDDPCKNDTEMRRRFDYAYDTVADTISVALPNLKELWICGFTGVKSYRETDSVRDVHIKYTTEDGIKTWEVARGVLLDRVDDGRLSYGAGPVKRLPRDEKHDNGLDRNSRHILLGLSPEYEV